MEIKPILFSTPMVHAILNGRKTMTRRVIKPQPCRSVSLRPEIDGDMLYWADGKRRFAKYEPGDLLWVRETWFHGYMESKDEVGADERWFEESPINDSGYIKAISGLLYRASTDDLIAKYDAIDRDIINTVRWKPSIHMPKEAARIFMRVTDVRVERVQNITHEDAIAEGVSECSGHSEEEPCDSVIIKFKKLWDSTIDKKRLRDYGWDANPLVWVYTFERTDKPKGWCE